MRYLISGSRYLPPLLFAIFLITTGCSDGPVSLQETCCKGDRPKPELGVSADKDECLPDSSGGGVINISFEGLVDSVQTEYTATDSIGNEIGSGIAPDSGSVKISTSYSGTFDVHAEDMAGGSKRSASDTVKINCVEKPAGPGQLKDIVRECYDTPSNHRDGRFGMTATLGFDRAKLVDVQKDSVLTDSTGITPTEDQRIVWEYLYDSKFKSILYKNGEKIYAEAAFSCDVGPGEIDVQKTCDVETGQADFTITVENGFDYMPVNRNGNLFEEYGDGIPEPNQAVSESDVPNGDYLANPERSGIENSKEFSIACEEEQEPPISNPKVDSTDGLTAYLNGLDSEDPDDNEIATYKWTFPDGSVKYGALTEFTFSEPGTYTVDLQVTDIDSLKDAAPVEVTVEPELKKCQCTLSLLGSDDFAVWGKAKGRTRLAVEGFEVLPKEPVQGSVGIRIDARYGGQVGDMGEPHEGFFLAARESGTSDYTTFSDNIPDEYTGIELVWLFRDELMKPSKFDIGLEYDFEFRHQSAPPKNLEDFDGTDQVTFRDTDVSERGDYIRFEFLAYSCPEPYTSEKLTKAAMDRLTR